MGPLHGFPHAVKDMQPVKGIRSTSGSPILKEFVPTADSLMVKRLRNAGAIIIGKTNTPEFGLGSHTYNPIYGVTRNAYDQSRSAGGSSGGAAVALALRMLPVADGSDYGGSLRNPAGWNNVFGFRTSYGRVPADARDFGCPQFWRKLPHQALRLLVAVQERQGEPHIACNRIGWNPASERIRAPKYKLRLRISGQCGFLNRLHCIVIS